MNNLIISIRKFLKNKNTVTVIGVVIIVAILYFGYNAQIKNETSPVQVCVTTKTIQPREMIGSDNTTLVYVPNSVVRDSSVYRNCASIYGMHANYNTMIPNGSLIYSGTVVPFEELPDANFVKVKEGEVPFKLSVNMDTTYGNAIFPGTKVDIFMKANNEAGQLMVGKLISNVEVLFVKDSAGRHVFENTAEERIPAYLMFGLIPEQWDLLTKATYMANFSVELFPVPHGGPNPIEGATEISSQQLRNFINANTIPSDYLTETNNPQQNAQTEGE